jgi:hypothetical protein
VLVDFLLEVAVSVDCAVGADTDPPDEDTVLDGFTGVPDFVGAICPVDFDGPLADELLEVDGPFDPAEPVASADAAAGIDAMAAPTPKATAEAPSHAKACELPSAARPNSTRLNCILPPRALRRPFASLRRTRSLAAFETTKSMNPPPVLGSESIRTPAIATCFRDAAKGSIGPIHTAVYKQRQYGCQRKVLLPTFFADAPPCRPGGAAGTDVPSRTWMNSHYAWPHAGDPRFGRRIGRSLPP